MVAAASDLGACVCEDDATVSELDDLRVRVVELEAERDALAKRVDEVAWTHHADDYVAHRFNQEWDRAEAAEARVRVQAEQIAALQEALRQVLDCRGSYNGTVSMYGGDPAICTKCEAVARDALALDEGCAAPAPRVPAEPCVDCTHDYCRCAELAAAPADEEEK